MWARRDYFFPHFYSLLFSLLYQTRENVIFHLIFLFLFSILPVFTPTKHTLTLLYVLLPPGYCLFAFSLSYLPFLSKNANPPFLVYSPIYSLRWVEVL